MPDLQPPPTWAEPVIVDEVSKKGKFNPVWLRWFLDLAQTLNESGGTSLDHNSLDNIQGGSASERYHLTLAQYTTITVGPIPVSLGGTGAATFAAGGILIGNTTGAIQVDSDLTWDAGNDQLKTPGAVLSKASGKGIKVDPATPTFPWHDIIGQVHVEIVGPTSPAWATYRNGINQYQFAVNDEIWNEFHIPHDYLPGSDLHLHVHWSHDSAAVNGGSVTWGFEVTYSKGHNQAAFPATVTATVVGNASTTQYQHIITEVQISAVSPSGSQIDTDNIEPDGVMLVRTYLSANNMTGATPDPFVHFVDVHYQSTNIGTKQKAPDFYS